MPQSTQPTEPLTKSGSSETAKPASQGLLDLGDDTPLLCPYQRAGIQDGEECEACQ